METIKDIWWAVIDTTNDTKGIIDSVHRFQNEAYRNAEKYREIEVKVERVRVTIDRIKV